MLTMPGFKRFIFWIFQTYVGCSLIEQIHGQICENKTTWAEAVECCTSRFNNESGLPTISNRDSFHGLMDQMEQRQYTSTWLGFQRRIFSDWQWINSIGPSMSLSNIGTCAYLNRSNGLIIPDKCASIGHGYICQLEACDTCGSLGIHGKICKKIHGQCYLSFCEKKSWYNARAECLTLRGDLAVLKEYTFKQEIAVSASTCYSFWIGVTREMWGYGGSDLTPIGMWGVGEPSDQGNCAILIQDNREFEIQVSSCLNKHPYICADLTETTTMSREYYQSSVVFLDDLTTSAAEKETSTQSGIPIGAIIAISFLAALVGLVSIATFVVLKRYKASGVCLSARPSTKTFTEHVGNVDPDEHLLSPQNEPNDIQNEEDLFGKDPTLLSHLKRKVSAKIKHIHGNLEIWSWSDRTAAVPLDDIYTELSIQRVISRAITPEETEMDSYNVFLCKDGLDENEPVRVILIGDAGTGKTTLCKKILRDWVKSAGQDTPETANLVVDQFAFILPIILRHVCEGETAIESITRQLQLEEYDAHLLKEYIGKHLDRVLLIFDGYDEFNESTSTDITYIANGQKPNANVFVTARAVSFGQFLINRKGTYTKVVLKGFSEKGVNEYIDKCYEDNSELKSSLKEKIKSSADLVSLSKFPAILLLIVVLWKDCKRLSLTVTGFYQDFVDYICARKERKEHSKDLIPKKDLATKYGKVLMNIGEIAINGLLGEKIKLIFPFEVVEEKIGSTGWNLGLFRKDEVVNAEQYVSFYHKTVQEYFASYFIVNCSKPERDNLLSSFYAQSQPLKDTTMMSRFLSGLGGIDVLVQISQIIEESPQNTAAAATKFHLDFLKENPSKNLILPSVVHLSKYFSQSSGVIKKYLSMDTSNLMGLTLEICEEDEIGILKYLNAPKLENLKLVYIHDVSTWEGFEKLPNSFSLIISKFNLKTFSINAFQGPISKTIQSICKFLPTRKSITHLDFAQTEISDELIEWLAGCTESLPNLRKLTLPGTDDNQSVLHIHPLLYQLHKWQKLTVFDISERLVQVLPGSPKMQRFPSLTELRIGHFLPEDNEGGICFMEQLKNLSELKILQAGRHSLGNKGIQVLASNLQYLKLIVCIDIASCGCTDKSEWLNFVSQIKFASEIQTLILACNPIGNDAVLALEEPLQSLQHIKHVDLTNCGFSQEECARAIVRVITGRTRKLHLALSGNDMSFVEEELIAITSDQTCVYLELENTGLLEETVDYIEQQQQAYII